MYRTPTSMDTNEDSMIYAAKIMASTASTLIKNPKKIDEAKKEFNDQISRNPYICPIPVGVKPPISKD